MEWTKENPVNDGHYWVRYYDKSYNKYIEMIILLGQGYIYNLGSDDMLYPKEFYSTYYPYILEFQGPINPDES